MRVIRLANGPGCRWLGLALMTTLAGLALTRPLYAAPLADGALAKAPLAYEVLTTQDHGPRHFTQGLAYRDGTLYESSGLYGRSFIVTYPANSTPSTQPSAKIRRFSLPDTQFAEGLTLWQNRLYLLTWNEETLWIFDAKTLQPLRQHRYTGQGWGLTQDNQALIRSDGSSRLYWHSPSDFAVLYSRQITGFDRDWSQLNELEWAEGFLWANQWQTSVIAVICPDSGQVVNWLDLDALVTANTQAPWHQSLNGIAFVPEKKAFWITGKEWRKRYLIKPDWAALTGACSPKPFTKPRAP